MVKTEEWTSKDGSKSGTTSTFEVGDKCVAQYPSVRTTNFGGFDNYSLAVVIDGETEVTYIKLTPSQAESLKKAGDLLNKTIEAYEYESKNRAGKFIGVRVVQETETKE